MGFEPGLPGILPTFKFKLGTGIKYLHFYTWYMHVGLNTLNSTFPYDDALCLQQCNDGVYSSSQNVWWVGNAKCWRQVWESDWYSRRWADLHCLSGWICLSVFCREKNAGRWIERLNRNQNDWTNKALGLKCIAIFSI